MTVLTTAYHRLRALRTFHGLIKDPGRLDQVLSLTSSTAALLGDEELPPALTDFITRGEETPIIDVDALRTLPEGTLGRCFADHMDRLGFHTDDLEHDFPSGNELALVSQHIGRMHDVHHVLTGFGTDIPGEIGLQAFYLANFEAGPSQAILAAVMLRPLVVGEGREEVPAVMDALTEGWQRGKQAACIFGVDWSAHWDRPLADVQADFRL